MAEIRRVTHAWRDDEGFRDAPIAAQKQVALRLLEEETTEDQLAGVLALSEILLPYLSARDLPAFARLFVRGGSDRAGSLHLGMAIFPASLAATRRVSRLRRAPPEADVA